MYEKQIAAGIKLLDQVAPSDWRERVREHGALTGEQMASTVKCGCVLSKATEMDYFPALKVVDINYHQATGFGFCIPSVDGEVSYSTLDSDEEGSDAYETQYTINTNWDQLAQEWNETLRIR
jgi:hypothetical protein